MTIFNKLLTLDFFVHESWTTTTFGEDTGTCIESERKTEKRLTLDRLFLSPFLKIILVFRDHLKTAKSQMVAILTPMLSLCEADAASAASNQGA